MKRIDRRTKRIVWLYVERRKERKEIAAIIHLSYRRVCELIKHIENNDRGLCNLARR